MSAVKDSLAWQAILINEVGGIIHKVIDLRIIACS